MSSPNSRISGNLPKNVVSASPRRQAVSRPRRVTVLAACCRRWALTCGQPRGRGIWRSLCRVKLFDVASFRSAEFQMNLGVPHGLPGGVFGERLWFFQPRTGDDIQTFYVSRRIYKGAFFSGSVPFLFSSAASSPACPPSFLPRACLISRRSPTCLFLVDASLVVKMLCGCFAALSFLVGCRFLNGTRGRVLGRVGGDANSVRS